MDKPFSVWSAKVGFACVNSSGNAIIAELLRLKDFIPPPFLFNDKNLIEEYKDIIFDYRFLDKKDYYEHKISSDEVWHQIYQQLFSETFGF